MNYGEAKIPPPQQDQFSPQRIADQIIEHVNEENFRDFLREVENIIGTRLEMIYKENESVTKRRKELLDKFVNDNQNGLAVKPKY